MTSSASSSEINLAEVIAAMLRHKRILFGAPALCIVLAIVYLHTAERKYSIELKITPTVSATSTLPAGIGSLANLAGISLPGGSESNAFDLYLEGLKSRETSAEVSANTELLAQMFPNEWQAESQKWVRPSGLVQGVIRIAKRVLGVSKEEWAPPDAGRVNEFLDQEVSIIRDRNSPIVRIAMNHSRPEFAQELLMVLHHSVDLALRKKELDRTSAYVAYLSEQLTKVAVTEYRQALHDIIAEQEKRRMVASSDLPFAAEPFGLPIVSVKPTSPNAPLAILLACFVGGLLGMIGALGANQVRNISSDKL